jgi:hypothetical protein
VIKIDFKTWILLLIERINKLKLIKQDILMLFGNSLDFYQDRQSLLLKPGLKIDIIDGESSGKDSPDPYVRKFPYQQIIGSILFLAICTRPMIAYAISYLAKVSSCYNRSACKALEWLMQYVYNTRNEVLILGGDIPRVTAYWTVIGQDALKLGNQY